jgi:hypothetical protein
MGVINVISLLKIILGAFDGLVNYPGGTHKMKPLKTSFRSEECHNMQLKPCLAQLEVNKNNHSIGTRTNDISHAHHLNMCSTQAANLY